MKKYIVLLRGINVSGKNVIKMDALRDLCFQLGYKDVTTYKQSGNIVLVSKQTASEVKINLEQAIKNTFGLDVPVLVLSQEYISRIDADNPLMKQPYLDKANLYFIFLFETPAAAQVSSIPKADGKEVFRLKDDIIYLYCPDGYGKTKWNNNFFESKLKLQATTRNWQTVQALLAM